MKLTGDRNQCPGCSLYFNSSYAFDKHRLGDHQLGTRACLSVAAMAAKGMILNAAGFWCGKAMPASVIVKKEHEHGTTSPHPAPSEVLQKVPMRNTT